MKKLILIVVIVMSVMTTQAQDYYITNEGYYFGMTENDIEDFISYLVDDDLQAANSLIAQDRVAGLPSEKKVFLVKSTWGGLVKLRAAGSTTTFWTVMEAIRKGN